MTGSSALGISALAVALVLGDETASAGGGWIENDNSPATRVVEIRQLDEHKNVIWQTEFFCDDPVCSARIQLVIDGSRLQFDVLALFEHDGIRIAMVSPAAKFAFSGERYMYVPIVRGGYGEAFFYLGEWFPALETDRRGPLLRNPVFRSPGGWRGALRVVVRAIANFGGMPTPHDKPR